MFCAPLEVGMRHQRRDGFQTSVCSIRWCSTELKAAASPALPITDMSICRKEAKFGHTAQKLL